MLTYNDLISIQYTDMWFI